MCCHDTYKIPNFASKLPDANQRRQYRAQYSYSNMGVIIQAAKSRVSMFDK